MLPLPLKDHISVLLSQDISQKGQAFIDKVEGLLTSIEQEILEGYYLKSPLRIPYELLTELDYFLNAGIKNKDSDYIKRKKIESAVSGHKKRGLWKEDVKVRIDTISGFDAVIYKVVGGDEWMLTGDGLTPEDYYWASLGADDIDSSLGIGLLGENTEIEVSGNVYINCHYGVFTPVLTEDQLLQIKEDLSEDITPAYFNVVLGYINEDGIFVTYLFWTVAELIPNTLSIPEMQLSSVTRLNFKEVALAVDIGSGNYELRTYRWEKPNWFQVGYSLLISGRTNVSIASLNGIDVALIDGSYRRLETYRWDGTYWSQIGSSLYIPFLGSPKIVALTETDIAFVDGDDDVEELRTYTWDKGVLTWSQIGNSYSFPYLVNIQQITTLNEITIVLADWISKELRTYSWDGVDWSLLGTPFVWSVPRACAITAMNGSDVALFDRTTQLLETYRWDWVELTWSQIGDSLDLSGETVQEIIFLDKTDIAVVVWDSRTLSTYHLNYIDGVIE